jgi:hypothetical protein
MGVKSHPTKKKCHLYVIILSLQTPGPLVRQRTIPTERPPLVGEVSANYSFLTCIKYLRIRTEDKSSEKYVLSRHYSSIHVEKSSCR